MDYPCSHPQDLHQDDILLGSLPFLEDAFEESPDKAERPAASQGLRLVFSVIGPSQEFGIENPGGSSAFSARFLLLRTHLINTNSNLDDELSYQWEGRQNLLISGRRHGTSYRSSKFSIDHP